MRKQGQLPGIPERPTAADVKAFVKSRLVGFDLRQRERARRRAARPQALATPPRQENLF